MQKKWQKAGLGLALGTLLVMAAPLAALAADSPVPANGFGQGMGRAYGSMINVVADFLGLSADEVRAQRWEGKSLADIAADQDVTAAELQEAISASRQANLEDAAAKGAITREQADLCLEQMNQRIATNLERTANGRPDWAPASGVQGQGQGRGARMSGGMGIHAPWNR